MGQQAQHTPGPWEIRPGYGLLKSEIGPSDRAVATVWVKRMEGDKDELGRAVPTPWAEGEANARLLSAAPDLLEALRPFANYACDEPCDCHNCRARRIEMIDKIVHKAGSKVGAGFGAMIGMLCGADEFGAA